MSTTKSARKVRIDRRPGELLSPLKAIRSQCLGCCGSSKEAALCTVTQCPLWPYRFGTRTRALKIVAEELDAAIDEGERWWAESVEDYTGQAYYRTRDRDDEPG